MNGTCYTKFKERSGSMEKNENKIVDVIATSDMHSHFLNGDYGSNIYRAGTYVNEARKNNENVILLDSGGSLAGSLAAFYYAVVAPYKRHPMIKLMNAMQYDASGISPNEFKFGLSFLLLESHIFLRLIQSKCIQI